MEQEQEEHEVTMGDRSRPWYRNLPGTWEVWGMLTKQHSMGSVTEAAGGVFLLPE